jgi:hypothetical protein
MLHSSRRRIVVLILITIPTGGLLIELFGTHFHDRANRRLVNASIYLTWLAG